jgi:PPOX class probable F420-dependent enzyme
VPIELNAEARELIRSKALGHVVTLNPDGSPQVSCVWVGFDEVTGRGQPDEVCFASLGDYQKIKNLRRDPRVAVSIETAGPPNEWGLVPYLVLHGAAQVTEGGGPAVLQQFAETYLGPGTKFPAMDDPPEGYVVRITVDRVGGVGTWKS